LTVPISHAYASSIPIAVAKGFKEKNIKEFFAIRPLIRSAAESLYAKAREIVIKGEAS
jgi:hypothetical protein